MAPDPTLSDHDANGNLTSPFYGYLPVGWASELFTFLFLVSTVLHFTQAIRSRTWWLLPTVCLAGFGEVLGWACRSWSFYKPLDDNPYLIQIVALIVSPTPLIGALFITFGRLSARMGQQYGRISPRMYSRIFLTSDVVSLVVQSAGGGIAATAHHDVNQSKLGSNIMLGGIIFQLVSLTVFCVLLVEYLVRRIKDRPLNKLPANNYVSSLGDSDAFIGSSGMGRPLERPLMQLSYALCIEALLLYIRGVYRVVELADGWGGKVIQTQSLFFIFDAVMVFLTMAIMNGFHPARLLNTEVVSGAIPLGSKVSV
ncbi:RTA1 like protein [Lenzites betulinus]|nr:RTA1 like protein [Lenzites betulinus]